MTREQIEQNARVYANKEYMLCTSGEKKAAIKDFIAGAHSRNEEIEELKKQIERLSKREQMLFDREVELIAENDKLRNPWISVKERLPEEGQTVIVRLAFGAGNHATCNYSNGQFVWALCIETSNINIQSSLKLPAITHWMPIPQIEKGE